MSLRGRELLTADQREEFVKIPVDISEHELGAFYTLSQFDHEIIKRHRRDHNRLGFAVQLCVLRYPGWSLTDVEPIPRTVLQYIARQINVDPNAFDLYAQRIPTKYEHLEEIKQVYGYKSFSLSEYRKAAKLLLQTALKNGNIMYLLTTLKDELCKQKIILPSITTMERLVWETRKRAEEKVFNNLTSFLSEWQKLKLNELITPSNKLAASRNIKCAHSNKLAASRNIKCAHFNKQAALRNIKCAHFNKIAALRNIKCARMRFYLKNT